MGFIILEVKCKVSHENFDVNIEKDPKHYTDLQALSSKESFYNLN